MGDEKLTRHDEFFFEEFKALRSEIEHKMSHLHQIVYVNLFGSGVIWYFLLDRKTSEPSRQPMLYWMPFLLSFLCGLYTIFVRRDVQRMGKYIKSVEKEFRNPDSKLGWEHFIVEHPETGTKDTPTFEAVAWGVFMAFNIYGAYCLR